MGASAGQSRRAIGVESLRPVPPHGRPTAVVAPDFVIGDGQVDPAVLVEVGGDVAGGRVREEPGAIRGGEAAAIAVPINEGVAVAGQARVIRRREEIQRPVVVEVGHRQTVDAHRRQLAAPVLPQSRRAIPVDVEERVMRDPNGWIVPAENEVEEAAACQVGRPRTGRALHRQGQTSLHAEPVRPTPQDKAPIVEDHRHNQVEPAVVVQVGQLDPSRILVDGSPVVQSESSGYGRRPSPAGPHRRTPSPGS